MAQLQRKSLRHPDEARPLGRGRLELVELGETAIGRVTYQPGWRWSEDVQPLVGTEACETHHIDALGPGSELASYGAFLPKPFSADVLVRAVQGAVRRSRRPGARSNAAAERPAEA